MFYDSVCLKSPRI